MFRSPAWWLGIGGSSRPRNYRGPPRQNVIEEVRMAAKASLSGKERSLQLPSRRHSAHNVSQWPAKPHVRSAGQGAIEVITFVG